MSTANKLTAKLFSNGCPCSQLPEHEGWYGLAWFGLVCVHVALMENHP